MSNLHDYEADKAMTAKVKKNNKNIKQLLKENTELNDALHLLKIRVEKLGENICIHSDTHQSNR